MTAVVIKKMSGRRPALIARCRGVADVIACLQFAARHELLQAVRGGGHNVAGFGTCDGGLVIDLSPMNGRRVDPRTRTARAGAGATWADMRPANRATPGWTMVTASGSTAWI
jgi:FAD/FMN-containing dehydrogenase